MTILFYVHEMKVRLNSRQLFTFILLFCFLSCEKTDISNSNIYSNMPVDNRLIGDWYKRYSVIGDHNSITVYTDSIEFISNNFGNRSIYKFLELDLNYTFQFYTEDSVIYLKYDHINVFDKWSYTVRNDSLFISGRIPYIR